MKLSYEGLRDTAAWQAAGVALPRYDWEQMAAYTQEHPVWVHFGGGNIFRGFIAGLQQRLLNRGAARGGIVVAETFDADMLEKIYSPCDGMTLMVTLLPDGSTRREVIASVACALSAAPDRGADWEQLQGIFRSPELQMVSYTITEKGYALTDLKGELLPLVRADLEGGPARARHAMSVSAAMLYARYQAGAAPIALVSMDNCSHNGEKLRAAVTAVARGWAERGLVPDGFVKWVEDEKQVSFPWTMIDKITPRPDAGIARQLAEQGIEGMEPVVTAKGIYIAPFVNAEEPQYLVVEDSFPGGRPPLELAGVYMTDRDTVNRTERMKVTTCLNPLHTALAVYGCLLGYERISDEMRDAELVSLIRTIGYTEGLPVVTDPGIISPRAFIDEVVERRLPNPFIPDTPQRIATDTSQKLPVRFGETIKSYMEDPSRSASALTGIPLALAGWLRYLVGVDDEGKPMPLSGDPMMEQMKAAMEGITLGQPDSVKGRLKGILSNPALFGADLYQAGLAERVEGLLAEELAGPGAVRATLKKYLA